MAEISNLPKNMANDYSDFATDVNNMLLTNSMTIPANLEELENDPYASVRLRDVSAMLLDAAERLQAYAHALEEEE